MVTCFNRDTNGECLAYKGVKCHPNCQARIKTVDEKINLLNCLLIKAQSRKEQNRFKKELEEAQKFKAAQQKGKFEGWMSCYMKDLHRGTGGGQSESDSNRKTSMKQLMKDNRSLDTKPTKAQQVEYKTTLVEFENQVGEKMEKLGKTSMSHSRIDSYTGIPICFSDAGLGHCNGQRSAKGTLAKDCKSCGFLRTDRGEIE